eukprot:gene7664-7725_t
MTPPETDLDPVDWESFRADSHRALDSMIDHLRDIRQRPVWQPPSDAAIARFKRPVPMQGQDLSSALADFDQFIKPFATGNTHPLFMGWVHGAGTPVGMIAEMLAAGLNANCGGRNHIAIEVERQITSWMAQIFDFPADSSGIFVTGTSIANFYSLIVAREKALGAQSVRQNGLRDMDHQLVAYASSESHGCVRQAVELAGLGARNLRMIPSETNRAMRIDALESAIAADRAAGLTPFLIVGTAGSVNTGAIDDLDALADIAQAEDIWFHIDGAFGALAALSPTLKPRLRGLERADSIAFDFHKWLNVPYDAGFFLARDPALHRRAFAADAAYLSRASGGLAAGGIWPCDLGADLSRGFRALKTWFTFEVFGAQKLGLCIEGSCALARLLETKINQSETFIMHAPVTLNIACFGLKNDPTGALAQKIVIHLHESGLAAPSLTILDGIPVIRTAFINHRTRPEDIDALMQILESAVLAVAEHSLP